MDEDFTKGHTFLKHEEMLKRGKKEGQEAQSKKWKEIFQLVREPFKYST